MQVLRKQNLEVNHFIIGDQIPVGKYTATCQKVTDGKAIFLLDQYLDKAYQMNRTDTNKGGYEKSDLRSALKNADIDESFMDIKDYMIPFENGDLLRIATVGEMFGYNNNRYDMDDTEQWELMKERKNRIAIRKDEPYEWGWLQNTVKGSSASFAFVNGYGTAAYYGASDSLGVRPVFQLAMNKSGDLVSQSKRSERYPWKKETSELKELMDSYIRSGFTEERAFQIVLTMIENNIKK